VASNEAKAFVDAIAEKKQISAPDVVRKALSAYRYLQEVRERDGAITIHRADGDLERLAGL
jgi:hypothetical protein